MSSMLGTLPWSDWVPWNDLASGTLEAPPRSGVYEVASSLRDHPDRRLHIGESNRLARRVGLLVGRGKWPHSASDKIRATENVDELVVRWVVTARYKDAERALHDEHRSQFGCLPTYTAMTGRWSRP